MAKGKYKNAVKAMKEAKTPLEMIHSWTTQGEGKTPERDLNHFKFWAERKPEMIETFAHNILWKGIDRGILDAKTRTLATLATSMAIGSLEGVIAQTANAKGAGATEDEIMEIAWAVCYQVAKSKMAFIGEALQKAFEAAANVKPLKDNQEG
jgi:alkylhydroperoxidase/carboxymuconolactone decarboxylase family protein YurZ